jgi:hypothetical protein
MSILPIQTRFFGVSRPGKVSFITRDVVLEPAEQVLSATITGNNSCNIDSTGGGFLLNEGFNMATIQVGYVCQIEGDFTEGEEQGSIEGYVDPTWYYVSFTDPDTRQITLQDLDQALITTVEGAVGGVTLTFYEIVPVQCPVTVISSGAFFVDATVNRTLGGAFPDGEQITINETVTGILPDGSKEEVLIPIATFNYALDDGFLTKTLEVGCTYPTPSDVFITVARSDYYGATAPAAQDCRVTLEIYSESSPSLN